MKRLRRWFAFLFTHTWVARHGDFDGTTFRAQYTCVKCGAVRIVADAFDFPAFQLIYRETGCPGEKPNA